MTDFFDFESLCFRLKKVFTDDFNKKILPNVSHDLNIKLIPENVEFLVGPFMNRFFGPNSKVELLTKLYPIFDPENLVDRVVNGVSLEEAASLDKNITFEKFLGDNSVTSVPFYVRSKEISNKINADLENFSSSDNFTKDDIMTFTVVNYLCNVMRSDLLKIVNSIDDPKERCNPDFSYKTIEPFMQVKDPQIIKLFSEHNLSSKEQEKLQILQDALEYYNKSEYSNCSISFENSRNGHFEMTLPLPKLPVNNNEIKASIDFANVNDLAKKLVIFMPSEDIKYYLSKDLNVIKFLYKDNPNSPYPSCQITHKEFNDLKGNAIYLSSLINGALDKCLKNDCNQRITLSH